MMDDEDRDKLTVNCAKLVPAINWLEVLPKLIGHGIYRKEEKNVQRWEKNLDNKSSNREMYLRIRNRGPKAFDKFILCLEETGHDDLARILKPDNFDQVGGYRHQIISSQINTTAINVNRSEPIDQVRIGQRNVLPEINNDTINGNDDPAIDDSHLYEHDMYYTRLQHIDRPLKIKLRKSIEFMHPSSSQVMCYSMTSNPRGLVLIINNILFIERNLDRSSAEHDENNLKDLYEQMGFKVDISRNLTREEMLKTISEFSKKQELRHVNSTFVIIMSHGGEHVKDNRSESVVCGIDDEVITAQEILNFFTAENCVDMCKKPKVFIFQTCRGNKTQQFVISEAVSMGRDCTDISSFSEPTSTTRPMGCRELSDVLVAYSTLPGHVAHRDKYTGSWYIQILCEVIMNHAHNTELLRLLQMTDQRLSCMYNGHKECQTSVFMNYGFHKECYLNPGFFQDQNDA